MAEYTKPTVALIRVSSDYPPEVGIRGGDKWYVAGPRLGSQHGWYEDYIEVVRPLVVLDPEDREQVKRLAAAWESVAYADLGDVPLTLAEYRMQAALRGLTRPPKPAEPTGLGAVVEDAEGRRYVCTGTDWKHPWIQGTASYSWSEFDAVKVLSEGVTA